MFNSKNDPGPNPNNITSSVTHLADYTYPGGNKSALSYAPNQYIFLLEQSGMLTLPVPRSNDLHNLTRQVAANNGWPVGHDDDHGWGKGHESSDDRVMGFLREHIKHIIYIVKENRTFDQILGDLDNGANADLAGDDPGAGVDAEV